ncbi:DUF6491 family protein [Allosphingosinicella sp.]|jgi:hypothetical protein|uniref:DUF6491 family protein n=1 Tax=Allosphingosinicella sp. TaxID=2823234 RepID=UPI002F167829
MKSLSIAFLAAAASFAAPQAEAAPRGPPVAEEARIPFVQFRGIRDFRAEGRDLLYLQDRSRNWYRAELMGPCIGLPWARAIGVDTRGDSSFDRFSTLIVEGERCAISSLTRTSEPPPRRKRRA